LYASAPPIRRFVNSTIRRSGIRDWFENLIIGRTTFTVTLHSRLKIQQEEGRKGVILFSKQENLVSPSLPSSCLILAAAVVDSAFDHTSDQ
jgi:hypothetical protein